MNYVILDANGDFLAHYVGDRIPTHETAVEHLERWFNLEAGTIERLSPEIAFRITLLH